MSQRTKILIFSAGLVAIIILFLVVFFSGRSGPEVTSERDLNTILADLSNPSQAPGPLQPSGSAAQVDSQPRPRKEALEPLSAQEAAKRALQDQLTHFIERWASYSNQGSFDHIKALADQMTPRLQAFVADYILDIKKNIPNYPLKKFKQKKIR